VFEDPDAGTAEDKMRLFLIYYICSQQISDAEVDQYANALQVNYSNSLVAPLRSAFSREKIQKKFPRKKIPKNKS
jgi:hypothetical protein